MLVICEPQKLQILYESLEKSIPESLKVRKEVWYHLPHFEKQTWRCWLDAWPDYQSVITWPKKQEMKNDLDHCTNTYHIFTKDPDKLEEVLRCLQAMKWEQVFQIQGCQESVEKAIREVSASKLVQVDYRKTMLCVTKLPMKHKTSSLKKSPWKSVGHHTNNFSSQEINFQSIFLDSSHAELVNEQWRFGKNEQSLKYIQCCLQNFPGFGVVGPEGAPTSWIVMEQSCGLRMGYTVSKYQGQGNMWQIGSHFGKFLTQKNIPFYLHVPHDNDKTQDTLKSFEFKVAPCGWHQGICTPQKY
uniref:Glycine N-acyltransferase-like protein n=1 Tax=Loxodonta africana TaxID=9785 RepID=G3SYI5_LOXAF